MATALNEDIWHSFARERSVEKRNEILMHYIYLVNDIGRRLAPSFSGHYEYDDLISSGVLGLIDAIEKYDVTKGIKFQTYAAFRIKGAMIDQIRKEDWLPKSQRQRFKKVEAAYEKLSAELGRFPTDSEVAQYLSMSLEELNECQKDMYIYQVISLDEIIQSSGGAETREGAPAPDSSLLRDELCETLKRAIDTLTENEKKVINLYYYDELNQKEICKVLGLSESRISQLHSRALIKLKIALSKHYN